MVRIRLLRKLALLMNGIDVSRLSVGDIMELPDSAAEMMIAEGWGERVEEAMVAELLTQQSSQPETST